MLPSMVFFRRIFDEIAAEYPDVTTDRIYVDAMALFLVRKPRAYDVIVTETCSATSYATSRAAWLAAWAWLPRVTSVKMRGVPAFPWHRAGHRRQGHRQPRCDDLSAAMMLDWLARVRPPVVFKLRYELFSRTALPAPVTWAARSRERDDGCHHSEFAMRDGHRFSIRTGAPVPCAARRTL